MKELYTPRTWVWFCQLNWGDRTPKRNTQVYTITTRISPQHLVLSREFVLTRAWLTLQVTFKHAGLLHFGVRSPSITVGKITLVSDMCFLESMELYKCHAKISNNAVQLCCQLTGVWCLHLKFVFQLYAVTNKSYITVINLGEFVNVVQSDLYDSSIDMYIVCVPSSSQ